MAPKLQSENTLLQKRIIDQEGEIQKYRDVTVALKEEIGKHEITIEEQRRTIEDLKRRLEATEKERDDLRHGAKSAEEQVSLYS